MADPGRYALIVANNDYSDPELQQLRSPAQDADSLARVLGDPEIGGFQVKVLKNAPYQTLLRTVNRFFLDRHRDDTLLLHFSCHGIKNESGRLFFAAADTEKDLPSATALDSDWLNQRMDETLSRKIVLLLDCCYSGAFSGHRSARSDKSAHALDRLQGSGRVVLTASSAFEYAWEGKQLTEDKPVESVFTQALVRGLETGEADRDQDALISVDELYRYIVEVIKDAGVRQTPHRTSDLHGDLYIAKSRIPERPLPDWVKRDRQSRLVETRLGLVDILAELVTSDPRMASAARAMLVDMRDDDDSLTVRERSGSELERFGAVTEGALTPVPIAPSALPLPAPARPAPRRPAQPAECARLEHDDAVIAVSLTEEPLVATASRDRSARVWSGDGVQRARMPHGEWVLAAAPSSDGRVLATCARDRRVRVWDVADQRQVADFPHAEMTWAVVLDRHARRLATGGADAIARVWDLDTQELEHDLRHDGAVVALAFGPGGAALATASRPARASVWEPPGDSPSARVEVPGTVLAVAFDGQERAFAVNAGVAGEAPGVWDIRSGRRLSTLAGAERLRAAAFGAGGRLVVSVGTDDVARVSETASGRELARIPHEHDLRAIALDPAGRFVATAERDCSVRLWDGADVWTAD